MDSMKVSERMAKKNDDVVIEMADLATDAIAKGVTWKADAEPSDNAAPSDQANVTSRDTYQQYSITDDDVDKDMLRRAVADTGRWAYGTIGVEVWKFDDRTGKLVRCDLWFDPVVVRKDNDALMRLVDDTREDFVSAKPLAPGVGLAGALWSELSNRDLAARTANVGRHSIFNDPVVEALIAKHVAWREVAAMGKDPDQPHHLRLQLSVEAGIGLAAGVTYRFHGSRGLVIYMARKSADISKLKSETNERYLLSAADVIGSIACLEGPRRACVAERREERKSTKLRVKAKLAAIGAMEGEKLHETLQKMESGEMTVESTSASISESRRPSKCSKFCNILKNKLILIAKKCRGANNEPPPPFSTTESIWTFSGCFLTLLALLSFSDAIKEQNPEYYMVMGPFGALMTLQYSLTAAPASQPRNALLGQAIALLIALAVMLPTRFYQGPDEAPPLATNLHRSVGTALAICIMARLGVTHPPAGAAALIFTEGGYNFGHMGIMLAGNVIAIFCATVINNMNIKRQYPTFWGFGYFEKYFCSKEKKK